MGEQSDSLRECEMGACGTSKENAVNIGLFVLSARMQIVRSSTQDTVSVSAPGPEHPVSQIPDIPPPRTSLF
jgi:hypothetical protein